MLNRLQNELHSTTAQVLAVASVPQRYHDVSRSSSIGRTRRLLQTRHLCSRASPQKPSKDVAQLGVKKEPWI